MTAKLRVSKDAPCKRSIVTGALSIWRGSLLRIAVFKLSTPTGIKTVSHAAANNDGFKTEVHFSILHFTRSCD